ncbi:MAG: patatin-like phospholipase family protein [Gemmobacter sp.]|nr:patatin-like phospholipase family protein [Gemmobacter sp.]
MVTRINLALQGGGAHGAFTWGVLETLLAAPGIEIAGISGTSAGALNGAALKAGMIAGGREGAKAELDLLWTRVGALGDQRLQGWMQPFMPYVGSMMQAVNTFMPFSAPGIAAQVFSPYAYGPHWKNPLDRVVRRFQFENVCAYDGPRLFVSATNVRSGKIRVFSGEEITAEAILASACLPTMFQAVEIDDPRTGRREAFWDGGYSGNPALFPLFEPDLPDDIVVVSINPLYRDDIPQTPLEIQDRINEISFNSSLLRELRAIHFVKELIAGGQIARGTMKDVRMHLISDDALMTDLSSATKVSATPLLLHRLHEAGKIAGQKFLDKHGADLGKRTTIDMPSMFS